MRKWLKRILLGGLVTLGLLLVVAVVAYFFWQKSVEERLAYWRGELEAMGRPMTLEEIIPEPIPDEENAAIPYMAFEKRWIINEWEESDNYSIIQEYVYLFATSDTEITTNFEQVLDSPDAKSAIVLAQELTEYPFFQYDQKFSKGYNSSKPSMECLIAISEYARYYGIVNFYQGDQALGYKWLVLSFLHPNMFEVGSKSVDVIVKNAIQKHSIEALQSALNKFPPELFVAKALLDDFGKHSPVDEKAMIRAWEVTHIVLLKPVFGIIESSDTFASSDSIKPMHLLAPFLKGDWATQYEMLYLLNNDIESGYNSAPNFMKRFESIKASKLESTLYPNTLLIFNDLVYTLNMVKLTQAQFNLLRTDLALYIHKLESGSYPESLEALVPAYLDELPYDPFADAPLTYSRTTDTYELYSVGAVDGGRINGQPIPD